ncbi:MAG: CYTH domain-containing protein [Elusimicrobiota bacterium]|jgi:hypothetical protein
MATRFIAEEPPALEIEAKRRLSPRDLPELRRRLLATPGVLRARSFVCYDQPIDTPDARLLAVGAGLRIRRVEGERGAWLQFKGPGTTLGGLLSRSETVRGPFRSPCSRRNGLPVSSDAAARALLRRLPLSTRRVLARLAPELLRGELRCRLLAVCRKEKFLAEDGAFEPSLDRVRVYALSGRRLRLLGTFCEYENEALRPGRTSSERRAALARLRAFDRRLTRGLRMPVETRDKYQRASALLPD